MTKQKPSNTDFLEGEFYFTSRVQKYLSDKEEATPFFITAMLDLCVLLIETGDMTFDETGIHCYSKSSEYHVNPYGND